MLDPLGNPVHRSMLWSVFNKLRAQRFFDKKRLYRALGYLQSHDQSWRDYYPTKHRCDCADSQWRGAICKHSIAIYIESLVLDELDREASYLIDTLVQFEDAKVSVSA